MRGIPGTLPYLLVAAALALGWNLNGYTLLDPDEGRNAEVAREMAASNDYVLPRLDGLPYLDKPIVYFAAAAAAMEVLGPTETAARLPAYLFTLATIALVVRFARRRWGADAGWLAGLAFATMPLVLAYARTAIFDSTLTFCTTAAILWFVEDRPVPAWAAMGLGALTKGPLALALPLLVMVPYALAVRAPVRRLFAPRGLAVFAAIALPWFVAVTARIPEFPHYVFVRETFERVTTPSFRRTGPLYFYIPILVVGTFPWLVPALAHLGVAKQWGAPRRPPSRDAVLLACWVAVPFLFFTLNQSKLPQYVLPLTPAVALAAARTLSRDGIRVGWRVYAGTASALGIAVALLPRVVSLPLPLTPAEQAAIPPTALVLGIVLVGSALLVALAARRDSLPLGAAGYAVVVAAIPFASGSLLRAVGDDRSAAGLAAAISTAFAGEGGSREGEGLGGAVLGVSAYPPSLPFYLGRTIDVATPTARELTSNYIADYQERYRALPASPLKPAAYWREVLARCPVPTVFVTRTGDSEAREVLAAALPLVTVQGRYAAYGPCTRGLLTGGR